ncbi:MAG: hypothetical protein ACLVIY_03125 [Anaerobutyricum soehngenii]
MREQILRKRVRDKEKDKDTDAKGGDNRVECFYEFSKQSSEDDGKTKTANAATTSAASATTAKSEEASQAESAAFQKALQTLIQEVILP